MAPNPAKMLSVMSLFLTTSAFAAQPNEPFLSKVTRNATCRARQERLDLIYQGERHQQGYIFLSLHSALQTMGDSLRQSENLSELFKELQAAVQEENLNSLERSALKQKLIQKLHRAFVSHYLHSRISGGGAQARSIGAVFTESPSLELEQSVLLARATIRSQEADFFVDPSNKRHPLRESTPAYRLMPRYRAHIALEKGKAWLTLCTLQAATGCITLDLLTGIKVTFQFPNEELRHPLAIVFGKNNRITADTRDNLERLETLFRAECQGSSVVKDRDAWSSRMLSTTDQDFMRRFLSVDSTYIDSDFREKPLPVSASGPTLGNKESTVEAAN